MNRAGMAFVVGAFFCMSAAAQPQTGAQAGAQSSSQASVQAGQTQAQASGNASVSTSALGIVFDRAILKRGEEIPLSVGIQAIAAAQTGASAAGSDIDTIGGMGASAAGSGMAGGRGALGGVTSAAGGAVGAVTNTAASAGGVAGGAVNSAANAGGSIAGASQGAVGGLNAAGQLTSNSQGVFGLNGLNLNAAASNATQGSVV